MTTRVETDPGQQAQYDWKEWMLPVNEQSVKIYLHQVILSYSRYKYYTFSLTLTRFDIMRAIQAAFLAFGGTPLELWIDNPKQMILTHRKNGVIGYQEDFLKFCGLYGIEPTACQPYRAQTKGKVEREPRQITSDGYLHYGGNRYPVSMKLAPQEVWVESVFGCPPILSMKS